jgi:hypothetical protein
MSVSGTCGSFLPFVKIRNCETGGWERMKYLLMV